MASSSTRENNPWQIFDKARNLKSILINQSKNVGNTIKSTANAAGNKWKESSTVTKACIIGSATAVMAPLAILPVLSVVGFTSAGVAAGSLAASMQTATTVSGSVFALCQSAAATGAVAASTAAGVSLGAGATAAGVTAAVCRKKPRSQNNGDEAQVEIEEEEDVQEDGDEQQGGQIV
jgi:hypothetical protein